MINNFEKLAILESIKYIKEDMILGIGTGDLMSNFIDIIKDYDIKNKINIVVSSSLDTEKKLRKIGISSINLNLINYVDLYIDSSDEIDNQMNMIKGKNGGTFTKEKIIIHMSKKFICIVDDIKNVDILGNNFPLPIEIIPISIKYVSKKISEINGESILRKDFKTDNGNFILDIYNLNFIDPKYLEIYLNSIPGVIENGIFSYRKPDLLIITSKNDLIFKNNL